MIREMEIKRLHIGTSGWSYNHWNGVFYPPEVKPAQYLEYYQTWFDCVELNSSFYHLPKKMTASGWMDRTPENFRFCPKMSRFITHQRRLLYAEEALQNFFDVFDVMSTRVGPVLIQLPPGLHYDLPRLSDFLNYLCEHYPEYRFAIEVRHESWLRDEFFDLLRQKNMTFVIADSGKRYPSAEVVTGNFVYLRFHGNVKLYATDYRVYELQEYAEKIRIWISEGKEVWAFFNNDFEGYAVKNAVELKNILTTDQR